MKAIYDWVPWFRELSGKIAAGGKQYLVEKAQKVNWVKTPKLFGRGHKPGWVDPFSFLYTLAQKNTSKQRKPVYESVQKVFDIESSLPDPTDGDLYIFPTIAPNLDARFHNGTSKHSELLWSMFLEVTEEAPNLAADKYLAALKITGVAPKKLSHGLFLANPSHFLPIDSLEPLKEMILPIADSWPPLTFAAYESVRSAVMQRFAGATPFEINRVFFLKGESGVSELPHGPRKDFDDDLVIRDYGYPLNQILYGPPGTGKTWNTVARAVAIADGQDLRTVAADDKREAVKARFEELCAKGQVAMVTFHQNYAYEDFIEGIRPVVDANGDDGVSFVLRRGMFRVLADRAREHLRDSERSCEDSFDVYDVVRNFLEWVRETTRGGMTIRLSGSGKGEFFINGVYETKNGKIAGVQIRGNSTQDLARTVLDRDYRQFLDGQIKSPKDIKPTRPPSKSSSFGQAKYAFDVLKKVKEYHDGQRKRAGGHVLIIDEINRGNIARIFGELITLVEESRRIGGSDEMRVTLPYSGDEFGVPRNLYIIGTMNTADRSIALLDTALRRRFEFVEMMPDSSVVDRDVGGVNLRALLEAMNDRIRFLMDREHQIGHTYFLGVDDLEGLKRIFQKQIVPLLQEYFYDDWAKVDAVLAWNGFVTTLKCPRELGGKDLVDDDRDAYEVLPFGDATWDAAKAYRKIYSAREDDGATLTDGEQARGRTEADDG